MAVGSTRELPSASLEATPTVAGGEGEVMLMVVKQLYNTNIMQFEEGLIYHIYNQGNNRQRVFFNRENYLFFLRKIDFYLKPYTDIMAWCLMPNHFHLMGLVNRITLEVASGLGVASTVGVALSDADGSALSDKTPGGARRDSEAHRRTRTLNDSIVIMLRSYTNAINKQEKRSGKLFREKTKAECVNSSNRITPSFYKTASGTQINISESERQYPQVCFNYIHQNPLEANLVSSPEQWEFSSYQDYVGLRDGKLVSKSVAAKYVFW